MSIWSYLMLSCTWPSWSLENRFIRVFEIRNVCVSSQFSNVNLIRWMFLFSISHLCYYGFKTYTSYLLPIESSSVSRIPNFKFYKITLILDKLKKNGRRVLFSFSAQEVNPLIWKRVICISVYIYSSLFIFISSNSLT